MTRYRTNFFIFTHSWLWGGFRSTPDVFIEGDYAHLGAQRGLGQYTKECSMSRYAAMHKGRLERAAAGRVQVWARCAGNVPTVSETLTVRAGGTPPVYFLSGFSHHERPPPLPFAHVCFCTKQKKHSAGGQEKVRRRIYLPHTSLHKPAVMDALWCSVWLAWKTGFSFTKIHKNMFRSGGNVLLRKTLGNIRCVFQN